MIHFEEKQSLFEFLNEISNKLGQNFQGLL